MAEVLVKTHLIVTDVHEEYNITAFFYNPNITEKEEYEINWCGKIINTKPKIKYGKPIFAVIGSRGRIELNTTDMQRVEKCAKLLTAPKGRQAITSDTAHIYIIEENDKETLMGVLTHNHVKSYAPMFDKVDFV